MNFTLETFSPELGKFTSSMGKRGIFFNIAYFPIFSIEEVGFAFKSFQICQCVIVLPIGLLLFCGIVHFERFGGDPLKRSIYNMLIR